MGATYPVDDDSLTELLSAVNTSVELAKDGSWENVGGEYTLFQLLLRNSKGLQGGAQWSEQDVIRALVQEIQRIRSSAEVSG